MLIVNDKQLGLLQGWLEEMLSIAIKHGDQEAVLLVTQLLHQVTEPHELKPRKSGWGETIKSQVFGSKR